MDSSRTLMMTVLLAGCATTAPGGEDVSRLREEVRQAEVAFARTMADRDLEAFSRFVADDAVFINGGQPLRGKAAIVEHWSRFFRPGTPAPFAWTPDLVELSGTSLGYSTGPVSSGGSVGARFASTWRREGPGVWKVVFDNGWTVCPPPSGQ